MRRGSSFEEGDIAMLLAIIAVVAVGMAFYGTVLMFCLRQWTFFWWGLLALACVVLLVWLVLLLVTVQTLGWLETRKEMRAKIKAAEASGKTELKKQLEIELKAEPWSNILMMSLAMLLYIVAFGTVVPVSAIVCTMMEYVAVPYVWILGKIKGGRMRPMA